MNLSIKPNVLIKDKLQIENSHATRLVLGVELPSLKTQKVLGVDPGSRNAGFVHLTKDRATCFQIKFPPKLKEIQKREKEVGGVCKYILDNYSIDRACIEYAAFGNHYGQVALSEMRTMVAVRLLDAGVLTDIIPPLSIRKEVFGHAKIKFEEEWPSELHKLKDAEAALVCAIYAAIKIGDNKL